MRSKRATAAHVVAAVAALLLVLVMATKWYGTHEADLARHLRNGANIGQGEAGEVDRAVTADADRIIAHDEKNPWHERATLDRVLLVLLLLAVALPLVAAVLRAAGRPARTASALAALAAVAAALLLAYRIVNQPGNNAVTTVKVGAPLALCLLAVAGIASAWAYMRADARDEDAAPATRPDATRSAASSG